MSASMPAISLWQPWASLLVTHQPCEVCSGSLRADGPNDQCDAPMVKRFETRSWPCPPKLIGQRVAFHAAKRKPGPMWFGDTWDTGQIVIQDEDGWWLDDHRVPAPGGFTALPLGAVVGSGIVTACLPILSCCEMLPEGWETGQDVLFVCTTGKHRHGLWRDSDYNTDISDQLPYGDWTPGRYAWLIEDAAPTTERCPWCWGEGSNERGLTVRDRSRACPVCKGAGRCEPIPAKGKQRVWPWTPEAVAA